MGKEKSPSSANSSGPPGDHKYFLLIISVSVFAFLPAWLWPQCGEDEEGAGLLLLGEVKLACLVLWLGPNPSETPSQ